ncbi:MAG: hypothetical protein KDK37_12615, partial [Leptospiraceae bacterium]|nr:hypothetical protein [Leptospiraceae bacterium]
MKFWRWELLLIFAFLCAGEAFGEPLQLGNAQRYSPGYTMQFYNSRICSTFRRGKDLSLAEFLREPGPPRIMNEETPSFGLCNGTIWGKLQIENHSGSMDWILELMPVLDQVYVYRLRPGEDPSKPDSYELLGITGRAIPMKDRPMTHRNHVIPIQIAPGQSTYLMKFVANGPFFVPATLFSRAAHQKRDYDEQLSFGAYLGVVLAILG